MKLQFGIARADIDYRHRAAVFGIAERDGLIACVRITRDKGAYFDLPGGAVEGTETEAEAVAREFREETGLDVAPVDRLTEASQYFVRTDGEGLNNVSAFWTMAIRGSTPANKQEQDHQLVWMSPVEALQAVRHEAHAWAITCWLRDRRQVVTMV
ncbi:MULTISPECIES: NUDIX domain-containing protein [unclassified Brevundimonas]|uniref:NUDIX domain-containing protein n=1 Tax=unclassified Brevundimonas TaxID=2622653 RepID=UPI0025C1A582|nr:MULTISPECIES: NUDIX domain-containing protein [unclassified Brevundimonas]